MPYLAHSPRRLPSRCRPTSGCLLVALVLAAGCGDSEPSSAPSSEPDAGRPRTIVSGAAIIPSGINEYTAQTSALDTALHYFILFLPLLEEGTDFEEGPASMLPRLAESWSFSGDRRQLTFVLREDARWSDGVAITAADVRFTWQAQTSEAIGWAGAEIKARIRDVEAVDDHTVRFHYDQPYGNQLVDAVQGVIVPEHVWGQIPFEKWRESGAWFKEHAVSSGPFALERWDENERVILRRNEHYFQEDLPTYNRLVLRAVPDETTRIAQLRAGDLDVIAVEPAGAQAVEGTDGVDVIAYDYRQVGYVIWNLRRPLFQDVRVRRALTMGIDRQAIIDTLYFGYARRAVSAYMATAWVYNRDLEPLPYDPDGARALLAEAGFSDSDGDGVLDRDGEPFAFTLETNAESRLRRNIVVMIQAQLRRIGIEVSVSSLDFGSLIERERAGDFDASVLGLGVDTSWNLDVMFHSRSIGAHAWNLGAYSNAEVDRLIDEIQTFEKPLDSKPLHDRLQEILWQEQPVTILYQPQKMLASRGVTNLRPSLISASSNIRHWRLTDP